MMYRPLAGEPEVEVLIARQPRKSGMVEPGRPPMSMKSSFVVAAVAAAFWVMPSPAHALLQFAGDVGGTQFCATDQNAPCSFGVQLTDTNPVPNSLALGTSGVPIIVDGLTLLGSVSTATFGALNILDSSSLTISNISGAPVTANFTVSATGFVPPVTTSFLSGSGTWVTANGSSITLTWFNDPTNTQGADTATDRPGTMLASFTDPAVGPADSFSTSSIAAVSDLAPFSMTLGFDLTIVPGGDLISRGQTEIKPQGASVPEPSTLLLLGLGLGLIGLRRR